MAKQRYVTGTDRVMAVFQAMKREAAEEIAHALNLGAMEISARAKVLVPVDEGDLKDTIGVSRAGFSIRADGKAVVVYVTAGDTKQTANAAYRQEFGRGPGPGENPGHAAQPFMFPGYWSVRNRVRNRVKRAVKKAAKDAAMKGR